MTLTHNGREIGLQSSDFDETRGGMNRELETQLFGTILGCFGGGLPLPHPRYAFWDDVEMILDDF